MTLIKVCAWCGRDEQGRVACFRCGDTPAPARIKWTPTSPEVAACEACASGDRTKPAEASHGICPTCETTHFNAGRV